MQEQQDTPREEQGGIEEPTNSPNTAMPHDTMPEAPKEEHHAPMGPIIAAIIIVAVLAVGGLYYWGAQLNKEQQDATEETQEELSDEQMDEQTGMKEEEAPSPEELRATSESDEIAEIEADLEGTELENLDAELEAMEAELENL